MMEGYFVRTLGMHRVYNSAFMNMLKNEENAKYRAAIKNTLEFDPEILKRFVNFMNNPDEETAVAQFGKGDKYFGICTLMVTMPGLPMFGHGQIEGFEEKYGMEYRRAYRDETPDRDLIDRHNREIFPLMKRRVVFSGSSGFCLFDFRNNGGVNENVFAYTNRSGDGGGNVERALVLYNNFWEQTSGWVKESAVYIPQKDGTRRRDPLYRALLLHNDAPYFVLMRQQKTGRWFIRSSKAIFENGLFVILNGYEVQVYIDIYEVKDESFTRWARLNEKLNGASMKDPGEALQDMVLDEVYAPFWALFSKENVEEVKGLLVSKPGVSGNGVEKSVLDFINAAGRFLKEGDYEPFKTAKKHSPSGAENSVEVFRKSIGAYAAAFKELASLKSEFARGLTAYIEGGYELPAFIYAYSVFQTLASVLGEGASGAEAAALAGHWGLDRKFREEAGQNGVDGSKAYRVVEIAKAVLRRLNYDGAVKPAFLKAGKTLSAASVVIENSNDEDFKRILGLNVWEGSEWFNKESFEETLFFSAAFALQYAGADKVDSYVTQFKKAELESGYKLDLLISALDGKKPAAKKSAGTASGEKKAAPAKKPAAKKSSKK